MCILCNRSIPGPRVWRIRLTCGSCHAVCIQKRGGELLREARELWDEKGHAESWDAMIASHTPAQQQGGGE